MKEEPRAVCEGTLREASYSVGRMPELARSIEKVYHCGNI